MAGKKDTAEYKKWEYEDAHLTELGWKQVCCLFIVAGLAENPTTSHSDVPPHQAHALGEHIAALAGQFDVDAVIVSPLSRALQTAVGAFGRPACGESNAAPLLMVAQDSKPVRAFGPDSTEWPGGALQLPEALCLLPCRASRWSTRQCPLLEALPSSHGRWLCTPPLPSACRRSAGFQGPRAQH